MFSLVVMPAVFVTGAFCATLSVRTFAIAIPASARVAPAATAASRIIRGRAWERRITPPRIVDLGAGETRSPGSYTRRAAIGFESRRDWRSRADHPAGGATRPVRPSLADPARQVP